jgi:hypothetical protein
MKMWVPGAPRARFRSGVICKYFRQCLKYLSHRHFFALTSHPAKSTITASKFAATGVQRCRARLRTSVRSRDLRENQKVPIQSEDVVKKISLFAVLMLITVLGAGTASFAACTATSLTTGNGIWGIESQGNGPGGFTNYLMQVTFVSGGTFTGTEWESVAGTVTGPTTISGTWVMVTPASDCQGTITVTSPSTQTFHFAINNTNKGGTLAQTDTGYTQAGVMVAQGTIAAGCTTALFKNKLFSLYSYGQIPAAGGLVTGSGEIKFSSTGTTFTTVPTVTLDLGAFGNFTVPGSGTSTISANCTGSGTLSVPSLGQSFSVDTVVVAAGKEALWIVTTSGDNVSGYFLQ